MHWDAPGCLRLYQASIDLSIIRSFCGTCTYHQSQLTAFIEEVIEEGILWIPEIHTDLGIADATILVPREGRTVVSLCHKGKILAKKSLVFCSYNHVLW